MNLFKKIFGSSKNTGNKINIAKLLADDNVNNSIIALDNYICELCNWGDDIDILNEFQRNFYLNQNLEREVNNGGFDQFFNNSSGKFANDTIEFLNNIGAFKTALLLENAINSNSSEELEDLDQQFYMYEDDLNTLNIEYVRKYKDQF